MISTIIIFLIVLSVLVIFHELGHFLFCRLFKVKVLEFGLGFPPRAKPIFVDKRGTVFSLNWLPIGGYVAMAGDDDLENHQLPAKIWGKENYLAQTDAFKAQDTDFNTKPAWQRLIIICAGPVFSLLLGVICFTFLFSANGIPHDYTPARIGEVAADSPAALSGVNSNTSILELAVLDGSSQLDQDHLLQPSYQAVIDFTSRHRGETVQIVTSGPCTPETNQCSPDKSVHQVYLRTAEQTPPDQGSLGLTFAPQYIVRYPWWQMPFMAAAEGFKQSIWMSGQIIMTLGDLIGRLIGGQSVSSDVAGPIGIVSTVQKEGLFTQGIWLIIGFAGMLSINLAVMNMLPIPAVDGGRALLIISEKIFSRRKIAKIEGILNTVGFTTLIILMLIITFHDIFKIVYN